MFVGRWQPWHDGHRWLIDQRLNEGKNVLICIREVPPDDENPFIASHVMKNIFYELQDLVEKGRVKLMIIPDIESVNYGRDVGSDIIEHIPQQEIKKISATDIRRSLNEN